MTPLAHPIQPPGVTTNVVNPSYNVPAPRADEAVPVATTAPVVDFASISQKIKLLEGDWDRECTETTKRRLLRNIKVDVDELRRTKKIPQDETLIPVRVVDNNIRLEQPPFISYLKQSRRLAIFKPTGDHNIDTSLLEEEFTRVCQHVGWELTYFKTLDGAMLHGWDAVEITYDETMPGDFMLKHIGHEKLKFPRNSVDIQASEMMLVIYDISTNKLKEFVRKYGWKQSCVDEIIGEINSQSDKVRDEVFQIRKVFYKTDTDDTIQVCYYHPQCTDFLKAPMPLYLGRRELVTEMIDVPVAVPVGIDANGQPMMGQTTTQQPQQTWKQIFETEFPIEILYYDETEEEKIVEHKGRGFLDRYKQEAATAIRSANVNRGTRSSNVYASPKTPTGTGLGIPKMTSNELVNGGIYDNPLEFWSLPSPDEALIKLDQHLETANAAETNQVSWLVNNRKDSRKTAKEISSAENQSALLNGVTVTLFSVFVRRTCIRIWSIVQSRALQGQIKFLELGEDIAKREAILSASYDIFAAGDTDVIKRQEDLQRMIQDMPLIGNTALLPVFLADYLKKAYPTDGDRYSRILMASMQQGGQLNAILTLVKGLLEQFGNQMTPQQRDGAAQVIESVTAQPTPQNEPS